MYAIKAKPLDNSEDWTFCTCEDLPLLYPSVDGDIVGEFEEWVEGNPDWEYKIVEVEIIEKEPK